MQFLRKILGGIVMSVLQVTPQFLYPHSRQFPFDEVAEKIVRAMEKRNWKIPGITVEFDTYGSGEEKYQMISSITGDNFKLYFFRVQGSLNSHLNDVAALHRICIPKEILEVFNDESGPNYYLYVGNDWESDKEWFMNSIKVHSKLKKEPRRYLLYRGNTYKQRTQELVNDNDLNREYSAKGNEPVCISLEQKFNEITAWLKEFVLDYILTFPESDVIQPPTSKVELIPYTGPWSTVFSLCDYFAYKRIKQGQKNPYKLPPEDRHAYFGPSYRLVPLHAKRKDKFPEIATNGFIWCDVKLLYTVTQDSEFTYEVRNAMQTFRSVEQYIVAIKLKYANEVYVVDNSKFEETRQRIFDAIAPRNRLTDEELNEAFASRGATIIPITEYKGDYKEPIVLINRELDFDEIVCIIETKK